MYFKISSELLGGVEVQADSGDFEMKLALLALLIAPILAWSQEAVVCGDEFVTLRAEAWAIGIEEDGYRLYTFRKSDVEYVIAEQPGLRPMITLTFLDTTQRFRIPQESHLELVRCLN